MGLKRYLGKADLHPELRSNRYRSQFAKKELLTLIVFVAYVSLDSKCNPIKIIAVPCRWRVSSFGFQET